MFVIKRVQFLYDKSMSFVLQVRLHSYPAKFARCLLDTLDKSQVKLNIRIIERNRSSGFHRIFTVALINYFRLGKC